MPFMIVLIPFGENQGPGCPSPRPLDRYFFDGKNTGEIRIGESFAEVPKNLKFAMETIALLFGQGCNNGKSGGRIFGNNLNAGNMIEGPMLFTADGESLNRGFIREG